MSTTSELISAFTRVAQEIKAIQGPRGSVPSVSAGVLVLGTPTHKHVYRSTLGANVTLGAPSGTFLNGHQFMVELTQDATGSRTLAYNAIYRFSTQIPQPVLTTTAAKMDRLMFQYHGSAGKWDLMAIVKGF